MVRQIKKFCNLSWGEQRLMLAALFLTGIARAVILLLPFKWIAPFLGETMTESPMDIAAAAQAAVRKVGWVIAAISRYTPWESKCLVQAITGKVLLRRMGLSNTLYLGVGKDENSNLIAHAWLRCGETMVTGGAGRQRFSVVGKFADEASTEKNNAAGI